MPWGRTKPTVILHSQWEDVSYRVETLNTLIWMYDFMVRLYRLKFDVTLGLEEII